MLRTYLFKISLATWFTLWSPLLLIGLVSKKLTIKFVTADARGVLWLARIVAGIRWKLHGTVKPGRIVASKHMSILEIAVLETTFPNMFFIIKRELLWIPIYGWAFWRMGFIGVNRSRGATNMKILAERVNARIKMGQTLVIFPEGTRAKPGQGVTLRRGLLFIAEAAKIPILPVGTDSGIYWPKRGRMQPGVANVWIEPELPYNASLDELAAAIALHSA